MSHQDKELASCALCSRQPSLAPKVDIAKAHIEDSQQTAVDFGTPIQRKTPLSRELEQLLQLHFLAAYAQWEQKKKENLMRPILVGAFFVRNPALNRSLLRSSRQSGQNDSTFESLSLNQSSQKKCLSYNEINEYVNLYETNLLSTKQNPVTTQLKELDIACSLHFLDILLSY